MICRGTRQCCRLCPVLKDTDFTEFESIPLAALTEVTMATRSDVAVPWILCQHGNIMIRRSSCTKLYTLHGSLSSSGCDLIKSPGALCPGDVDPPELSDVREAEAVENLKPEFI